MHIRHMAWYVSANLQKRILICEKTYFYFSLKRLCFLSFKYSFKLSGALQRDNFDMYVFSSTFSVVKIKRIKYIQIVTFSALKL